MKKILTLILLLVTTTSFAATQLEEPIEQTVEETADSKYKTWLSRPTREQYYLEGQDDRKGLGRVFFPTMTTPVNEPFYAIYQDGVKIGESPMGTSFFLLPGEYEIILGSGTIEQRIKKQIFVERGQSLMFDPDWCALTIEVINESRDFVKRDLEIFRMETLDSYGIVSAVNIELGEQLQTFLLPAGLYKIVERGLDVSTYVNFATVQLEAGTYTPFTIVMDVNENNFIGSGVVAQTQTQLQNLKLFGIVHGSFNITTANDASSKAQRTNYNIVAQFDNSITYDKKPNFFLSKNLVEFGMLRQQGENFQVAQDRLQLKNSYTYFLLDWVGGYARAELISHMFPIYERSTVDRTVTLKEIDGTEVQKTTRELKLAPAFSPMNFKEGFGVNLSPVRTAIWRLNVRTGFGFRQILNDDVYQQNSTNLSLYERIPNVHLRGLEVSVISMSVFKNFSNNFDIDMLFPIGEDENTPEVDLENILSFRLTRNISVAHSLRLSISKSYDWVLQEQFILVRYSQPLF